MDMQSFIGGVSSTKEKPHDPFSHAASLMDEDHNDISAFSQICSKSVILANVEDNKLLRLYQNDIIILTQLYSAALREPELRTLFLTIYYGWLGELKLTRAKDGLELKAQHTVGSSFQPKGMMRGYGPAEESPSGEQNLIEKLFNKVKKKPQNEGGGSYG